MRPHQILYSAFFAVFFLCFFQGIAFLARTYWEGSAACNQYGPFGVPVAPLVLYALSALALLLFLRAWWTAGTWARSFGWLLIVTAGVSNLIERFWYGCVFDYLTFPFLPLSNGADVALFVSVVFLLWGQLSRNK